MLFRKRSDISPKDFLNKQPLLHRTDCEQIDIKLHCLVCVFVKKHFKDKDIPKELIDMTILFMQGGFVAAESLIYRHGSSHNYEYGQIFFKDQTFNLKMFQRTLETSKIPVSKYEVTELNGYKYLDFTRMCSDNEETLYSKMHEHLKAQNYDINEIQGSQKPFRLTPKLVKNLKEEKYFFLDGKESDDPLTLRLKALQDSTTVASSLTSKKV